MATLEHVCKSCGCTWHDNQPCNVCPLCGGKVTTHWDEEHDGHEDGD